MNIKKTSLFYWLISILVFIFFFVRNDISSKDICIKSKNYFLNEKYNGIIRIKKRDRKNHNMMMLEIEKINHEIDTVYIDQEAKEVYDFVIKGDSIVKFSKDSIISVFRNQKTTNFLINFNCSKY